MYTITPPTVTKISYHRRDLGGWLVIAVCDNGQEFTVGWVVKHRTRWAAVYYRRPGDSKPFLCDGWRTRREATHELLILSKTDYLAVPNPRRRELTDQAFALPSTEVQRMLDLLNERDQEPERLYAADAFTLPPMVMAKTQ